MMSCPTGSAKSWQIRLGRRTYEAKVTRCCPIAFEQIGQVNFLPESGSDEREETRKAVIPSAEESLVLEQDVGEESGPDLPAPKAFGVGVVAQEVSKLEGLLDLFEESFDLPATAIPIGHGCGAPWQKCPRLILRSSLPCQLGNQMRRNPIANLPQR